MLKASIFLLQINSEDWSTRTCYFLFIANFELILGVNAKFCNDYESQCEIPKSSHLNLETV